MATVQVTRFSLEAKRQLAEALGIDIMRVIGGINITVPVDAVPSVSLTLHLDDERMGKLAEFFCQYSLQEEVKVPIEDMLNGTGVRGR
jgi:hypothetical protein